MAFTQEQKKGLIAVIVFGIIANGLVYYYWSVLGKDEYKAAKTQLAEATAQRDRYKALYGVVLEFRNKTQAEYKQLEDLIRLTSRRLPDSVEAPGFLKALGDVVRGTGIEGKRLVPANPKEYANFTQIPYEIAAVGRYHQFGQFLNLIEENTSVSALDRLADPDAAAPGTTPTEPKRFMRIQTMELTNDEERPSLHPIDVDIATFMFNPPKSTMIELPDDIPESVKNQQKELW